MKAHVVAVKRSVCLFPLAERDVSIPHVFLETSRGHRVAVVKDYSASVEAIAIGSVDAGLMRNPDPEI